MSNSSSQPTGCLAAILNLFGAKPKSKFVPPYAPRDDFLSNAERSFYHVLRNVVGDKAVICPKVGVKDILYVNTHNQSIKTTYQNKIAQKHVDFVVCAPDTMQPLCAIELDDGSHKGKKAWIRDQVKNEAFEAAAFPLVRIENRRGYDIQALSEAIAPYLPGNPASPVKDETHPEVNVLTSPDTTAPMCPKCGAPMVRRIVKQGKYAGSALWGCSNYPQCKAYIPISSPSETA